MQSQWLFEAPFPSSEATRLNLRNYNQPMPDFEGSIHPDILGHCSTITGIVKKLSQYLGKSLRGKQHQRDRDLADAKQLIDSMTARVKNDLSKYSIRDLDVLLGCFGRVDHVLLGIGSKVPTPLINLRTAVASRINSLAVRNPEVSFEWETANLDFMVKGLPKGSPANDNKSKKLTKAQCKTRYDGCVDSKTSLGWNHIKDCDDCRRHCVRNGWWDSKCPTS